ncbi:hypothetical protein O6H91_13G051200 [Diphasiastrum complanatum]|uniref:Uncharacterized protein n=1 Tax=Diphasiastrum complanatum TaxID=34168 RepID=A0ACC2BUW0_DIPCM|nr:hypothetical protein O6H91_13G051200 [Diphasiastrum complanatum]
MASKPSGRPSSSSGDAKKTPPQMVYRADSRPPSEIFKNGFKPRGGASGDDDLLAHVVGGENLLKTGLISTSQSLRIPPLFLKPIPKQDGSLDMYGPDAHTVYTRRGGWVYYINTTNLDMVYVPDKLPQKTKYLYQQEWAVKSPIPGSNIRLAHHVEGYMRRYQDFKDPIRGPDALFPVDKPDPFKEKIENPNYAFKK